MIFFNEIQQLKLIKSKWIKFYLCKLDVLEKSTKINIFDIK